MPCWLRAGFVACVPDWGNTDIARLSVPSQGISHLFSFIQILHGDAAISQYKAVANCWVVIGCVRSCLATGFKPLSGIPGQTSRERVSSCIPEKCRGILAKG